MFATLDKSTILRRLDPRVKLAWLCAAWFLGLGLTDAVDVAVLLVVISVSGLVGGIPARSFAGPAAALAALGVQLLVLQALFGREGAELGSVGPLAVHAGSLAAAGVATLRLSVLCLSAFQFVRGTAPEELVLLLRWARAPYRYAALAGFALRFLPLMESELRAVMETQASRGMDVSAPVGLLRSFAKTLTPLLLRGLRRANDASLSLELRGYGHSHERTFVDSLVFRRVDGAVLALIGIFLTWLLRS